MLEVIKSKFTSKRKQNLENLYDLLYEVEVNKNNLIADLDKQINELKFQIMNLEEKVEHYKQKIKDMKEEQNGN